MPPTQPLPLPPDLAAIEPYDGVGRYLVPASKPSDPPYLVELGLWDGRGECRCKDWECRIGPARKNNEVPAKPWCKHVTLARRRFVWDSGLWAETIEQVDCVAERLCLALAADLRAQGPSEAV